MFILCYRCLSSSLLMRASIVYPDMLHSTSLLPGGRSQSRLMHSLLGLDGYASIAVLGFFPRQFGGNMFVHISSAEETLIQHGVKNYHDKINVNKVESFTG